MILIQLALAAEVARAGGSGGSGGGGRGGVCGHRLQRNDDADAGGGTRHSCKGALLANPACILVLTLQAGKNTLYFLWNVDLLNLGGSVWCKRWHHGGRCFMACYQKEMHTPKRQIH